MFIFMCVIFNSVLSLYSCTSRTRLVQNATSLWVESITEEQRQLWCVLVSDMHYLGGWCLCWDSYICVYNIMCVLFFDIDLTDQSSFERAKFWVNELKQTEEVRAWPLEWREATNVHNNEKESVKYHALRLYRLGVQSTLTFVQFSNTVRCYYDRYTQSAMLEECMGG